MHDVSRAPQHKRSEQPTAFYTMVDVAGICGIGYKTLWTQVKEGTFPVQPVKIGRQWKFPKSRIDEMAGIK